MEIFFIFIIISLLTLSVLYFIQYIRSKRILKKYGGISFDMKYEFEEKYLDIEGVKICYIEEGEGEPILFIHGWAASIDYWDYNIPYFLKRNKVYALDLPGYGKSGKPLIKYSLQYFTDTVKKFMDQKGIEKAIIVGHSMGGQTSINFALLHPERVEKLILVDPAGLWGNKGYVMSFFLSLFGNHRWLINTSDAEVKMTVKTMVFFDSHSEVCRKITRRHLAFRKTSELLGHTYASYTAALDILRHPLNKNVEKISVPTLIIWGKDDRLVSWRHGCFLAWKISDSVLRVIDKCGHCPQLEKPDEFNHAVDNFLYGSR